MAGARLLLSVLTPTYFAWVLNIPALVAGPVLLVAPPLVVGRGIHHELAETVP